MKRRALLAGIGVTFGAFGSGCIGAGRNPGDAEIPSLEEDDFPLEAGAYDRGRADSFVEAPAERRLSSYEANPDFCGATAMDAVHDHLQEAVGEPPHVSTAWGAEVPGVEILPVTVRFVIKQYVDGELRSEADIEYEDVLAATPPTAYLTDDEGELVCYTPVYAIEKEAQRIHED